jgi:hypothetical protein
VTLAFDYPTVEVLAEYCLRRMFLEAQPEEAPARSEALKPEVFEAELEGLSAEEMLDFLFESLVD